MCGRYCAAFSIDELREIFPLVTESPDYSPRYNVAPTQLALIVALENGKPSLSTKPFGFKARETLLINARAETLLEKKTFQQLGRCLIPATGFYEWRDSGKERIPYYFTVAHKPIFAFAGLYDSRGFVIVTTKPNETVAPLHNRMPAILAQSCDYSDYLSGDTSDVLRLLNPYAGTMACVEVTKHVNTALHDDEQCITPANKLW